MIKLHNAINTLSFTEKDKIPKSAANKIIKAVKTYTYTSNNGKQVTIYNYQLPADIDEAKQMVKGKSPDEILKLSGIYNVPASEWEAILPRNIKNSKKDKIISEYCSPRTTYSYGDIGVDEEWLLKNVIGTTGSFNLRNSSLKNPGSVQYIGGDLVIGPESKIKDLSSIKLVRGSAIIECGGQKQAESILKELNFNTDALEGSIIYIPEAVKPGKKLKCNA